MIKEKADEELDNAMEEYIDGVNSLGNKNPENHYASHEPTPQPKAEPSKIEPKKSQMSKVPQPQRKDYLYVGGEFSKYAMNREIEEERMKKYINSVIIEAVESHLAMKRKIAFNMSQIREANFTLTQNNLFKNEDQMRKFIHQPLKTFIEEEFLSDIAQEQPISDLVTRYIYMHELIREYCLVEGHIIHMSTLAVQNYEKSENEYIIPFKEIPDVVVKVDEKGDKGIFHKVNGKLLSRKMLIQFDKEEKERIVNTVIEYLRERNIVSNDKEITEKVEIMANQINNENGGLFD